MRDFCSHTLWPWLAVVLYLALNVHTLGTGAWFGNGGWGHFQKPHELNSPLMIRGAVDERCHGALHGRSPPGLVVRRRGMCVFVAYVLLVSPLIIGLFAVLAALLFSPEAARSPGCSWASRSPQASGWLPSWC